MRKFWPVLFYFFSDILIENWKKYWKSKGKVMEICQSENVGTWKRLQLTVIRVVNVQVKAVLPNWIIRV